MCTIKQGLFNEAECHKNDIYNKAYQDAKLTTGKIQPFKRLHCKKKMVCAMMHGYVSFDVPKYHTYQAYSSSVISACGMCATVTHTKIP